MIEFFRNIGQSADEKRIETLNAYLDGALTPREQQQLEIDLQADDVLRAELEQIRVVKLQMRALPRRRVPRSFSLDPALYGPPKARPAQQIYPVLRGATALTALLFVFVLGLNLLNVNLGSGEAAPAQAVTMAELTESDESSAAAPLAELELAAPVPQAEAGITIEEPAADAAQESIAAESAAAESIMAGSPVSEASAATAAATDDQQRPSADITGRKESSGGEALATGELAGAEQYSSSDEAQDSAATTAASALPPESAVASGSGTSVSSIAVWLGLATLVLGIATLLLRSRARL